MTHRTSNAFSLVELLVVVAIIALLVTMLLPSLQRGVELARRTACRTNCREIPKACKLYALENRYHLGGTARALPNVGTASGNWSSGPSANRECLRLLIVHEFLSPGSVLCPSIDKDQLDHFNNGDPCAYAFLSMVGRTLSLSNAPPSVVLVGDRNPRFDPGSGSPKAAELHQNSKSHKITGMAREGQNIGRLDESAEWITSPVTETRKDAGGSEYLDYIYEPGTGAGANGVATGLTAGSEVIYSSFEDVFLLN